MVKALECTRAGEEGQCWHWTSEDLTAVKLIFQGADSKSQNQWLCDFALLNVSFQMGEMRFWDETILEPLSWLSQSRSCRYCK